MPRNKKTDNKKAVIQVRSLADLPARKDTIIHLELEQLEGLDTLAFDLKQPSFSEWAQYEREVPTPQAPLTGITPDGTPQYNYQDADYLKAIDNRPIKVQYNRLIHCLQMDIPGETLDEKIAAFEDRLPWGVVQRLLQAIVGIGLEGERRILERADSFRLDGTAHPSANGTARVDNGAIPLIAGS